MIDRADVASVEKSLIVENIAVVLEVGPSDRRTADFQPSERLAVPRHAAALVVSNFHLDPEWRVPLLLQDVEKCVALELGIFGLQRAGGAERAHFGHAPGVAYFDVVHIL